MLILSVLALLYVTFGVFTVLKLNAEIQSDEPVGIITDDYATSALNILVLTSVILLWPGALLAMRENARRNARITARINELHE